MSTKVTFKTQKCGDADVKIDGKICGRIMYPNGEAMRDVWKIKFYVTNPSGYNPLVLSAEFNSMSHCKKFIKARIDEILERYSIHYLLEEES